MPAWIGLSDQREERYFEWSNLENVVFTAWDLKQPDISRSGENSHCVAINNQVRTLKKHEYQYIVINIHYVTVYNL